MFGYPYIFGYLKGKPYKKFLLLSFLALFNS